MSLGAQSSTGKSAGNPAGNPFRTLNPATAFINHVLAQQPAARESLARYAGRRLRLAAPPFSLALMISDSGEVEAQPFTQTVADVTLSVAATRVPMLFIDPETAMKDVRIEGDAEFAQTLARLAREVRWDVEEDLSKVLGDVPAHQMMRFARAFAAWGREAGRRMAQTGTAYFVDESPTLVSRTAVENYSHEVTVLRDDLARLEKRIELLEKRRGA